MEDTLQDACERAMQIVFPLPTMLRLYRSVIGLTRALMQARMDVGLPPGLSDKLIALLENVRDTTTMHFPDRDMPIQDATRLHAAIMNLARIAHRARVDRLTGPVVVRPRPRQTTPEPSAGNATHNPIRPDNAPEPPTTHDAQPAASRAAPASAGNKNLMHPEKWDGPFLTLPAPRQRAHAPPASAL